MKIVKVIIDSLPWIFSGVGVFVLGLIIKKEVVNRQNQKVSKESKGYQAGRDINITEEKDVK